MKTNLSRFARVAALAIPLGYAIEAVDPAPTDAICLFCNSGLCWPSSIGSNDCISTGYGYGCWETGGGCVSF